MLLLSFGIVLGNIQTFVNRKTLLLMPQSIHTITISDESYPQLLKQIKKPPEKLYVWGNLMVNKQPTLAVVGTRRYSNYGKQVTIDIVGGLARARVIIISGLANGIDSLAHRTTLEKGGRTIAVLGSGLDKNSLYPKSNLRLAEGIVKSGGALISEYPPGTSAQRWTFPERNRIISGLCLGTLIIEAPEQSGAIITAEHAIAQGRKVFSIPGSIYTRNSMGTNELIKKGKAKLVTNSNDILKELNLPEPPLLKIKGETEQERLILKTLENEALHIDKIIKCTGLSPAMVASNLSILESRGLIKNLGGNTYMKM